MFEIISKITLEIILNIMKGIFLHSHEFEDFYSEEYKQSDLREILKEEYLRVTFYEKVKNTIINNFSSSDSDIVRWSRAIADKEYDRDLDKKCDLFLEGEVIHKKGVYYLCEQEFKKKAWIELKFFTPINDNNADNSAYFIKDILRILFLPIHPDFANRYVIVLILCGKYREKLKTISNYFLKNVFFDKLFFPTDLNPTDDFTINSKELLSECKKSNIFRKKIQTLEENFINTDFDLIYFRRKIISPFFFNENIQNQDFNKKIFGYIFKLNGYHSLKTSLK